MAKKFKILLDTSILVAIFQNRVNLDAINEILQVSYEILIPSCVIDELRLISKRKKEAKAALSFIESKGFKILKTDEKDVDKFFSSLEGQEYIVATNDMKLRKLLISKGIKVLFLRQGKYFQINGEVGI